MYVDYTLFLLWIVMSTYRRTNVADLLAHFPHDSKNDILYVFLISRSNYAFVNYKTETACAKVDERFTGIEI